MNILPFAIVLSWLVGLPSASVKVTPPKPLLPVPSPAQLAWQQHEYYAFIHFGMNPFTDHERGEGRAHPDDFNRARAINTRARSSAVRRNISCNENISPDSGTTNAPRRQSKNR